MSQLLIETLQTRKGAKRRSEIPDEVLQALNQGKIETVNLVEYLAIDTPVLLYNILLEVNLHDKVDKLYREASKLKKEGITKQFKGIGNALFLTLQTVENRSDIFEAFASHTSNIVRSWATHIIAADKSLSLPERLQAMRRFAADRNMSVKEEAWVSLRPYLVDDLEKSFELLVLWVKDADANLRRCAVEATRPCGVWCKHVSALKKNPEPGLTLLEFVRSDPSNYVQRSVANWLNDASKSRPDWVMSVCQRWHKESSTKETQWIIKHSLRTIKKKSLCS